ncbi:MAG: deoxyribose-phosphate aldolase [Firmicutes bacterium]|nr:deoxyribose-phosphate aldolase [Bacillota bacterium]
MKRYHRKDLAAAIDHSLLDPALTDAQLEDGCRLAAQYGVASVCVKPYHVRRAAELLRGTPVKVGTVVGFPHGSTTTACKVFEAREALDNGAVELDMVMNIGAFKSGDYGYVVEDIRAVVRESHPRGAIVKVILENGYLSKDEIVRACLLARDAGADFVKTATGYGPGGATLEDVALMRQTVGFGMGVKAAKGIRGYETAIAMLQFGASRIAARATKDILDACPE